MSFKDNRPTGNGPYKQGKFTPVHPEKYLGDVTNIVFMSSYELQSFEFLDSNPNVLHWASEEIEIPYMKIQPDKTFRPAKYYPDLYVEYQDRNGRIQKEVIEIKPLKQTKRSRSRNPATKLQEDYNYAVNILKWDAAKAWCAQRGIKFSISTEKSIFR